MTFITKIARHDVADILLKLA